MRFAYADPPYFGLAEKFYGKLHPEATEYDKLETHARLIERLNAEFDGWAMSLHTPTLKNILPLCPDEARVLAWVKPFASFKGGVKLAYCWEPVILWGSERRGKRWPTVRDYLSANIALQRGFQGAKPEAFCFWIFDVLGIREGDEFVDLFPGSGAVGRAYDKWKDQRCLLLEELTDTQTEMDEALIEAQILTTDRTIREQQEDDAA